MLGVNATADATNRLTVSAPATTLRIFEGKAVVRFELAVPLDKQERVVRYTVAGEKNEFRNQ